MELAGKLHIDSFDLYIARARNKFAADLCQKFEGMPETIEADITRIIRECESRTDPEKTMDPKPCVSAITDKDKQEA